MQDTSRLLTRYMRILNRYGFDSLQHELFLDRHKGDERFIRLARMARRIKIALCNSESCH